MPATISQLNKENQDAGYEKFRRNVEKLTEMAWKAFQNKSWGYVQMSVEDGRVVGFVNHLTEKAVT